MGGSALCWQFWVNMLFPFPFQSPMAGRVVASSSLAVYEASDGCSSPGVFAPSHWDLQVTLSLFILAK